jgi:hypothetical protein
MDVVADRGESGRPEAADASVDRRPYADLPDRSRKWPRPVRVLFIAGSAAALWGLIFAGIRLL